MATAHSAVFVLCMLLTVAAWGEDAPKPPPVGDVIYKGVVGVALEAVPMDPERRVVLQRTNAVVSNTLTGRSLAVWAGLTNPILMIGGLVWGIYAALNIKTDVKTAQRETPVVDELERTDVALGALVTIKSDE